MLYFPNGRPALSTELPIASGASIAAEGQCLVGSTAAGGVFGVAPSAGSAGENFLGFAVSQQIAVTAFPKVEEKVSPNTDIITLARTPNASSLTVWNVTTSTLLVVTTDYTVSGKTVTMGSSYRGHTIRFIYKFTPTAVEARAIQGDVYPGGAAGTSIGQVGIFQKGTVYTSEFNSAVDWQAANPAVKTGANGLVTIGGSGATIDCVIVQIPSTTNPYLGLLLK